MEKLQVENQEAMKGIIASVNQQKRQAMTMQLPPHFVSPHRAGTIPLPTSIPVESKTKHLPLQKKKVVKNVKAK